MKKSIAILLAILSLFLNINTYAINEGQTNQNNLQAANENLANPENEEPKEVRDQNILVPTKEGVQKATAAEAQEIRKYENYSLENLTASYLLGDFKSQKILKAYNIDEVRAMASTSKLVSIFVVLDKISEGSISKTDIVTIDRESALLGGSTFELKENQNISVEDLIKASMIVSGNDAITALAKYISGSKEAFVVLMNEKCRKLGLKNAHMVNPTGLTDYAIEDYNKMTTREMFILSCELLKYHPEILDYTKEAFLKDEERNFLEYNTNPLLGIIPEIDGLKTGYTNASGRTVIETGIKKGVKGKTADMRLIGILTGSRGDWQRYVAARRLMSNAFEEYKYTLIGGASKTISNIKVADSQDEMVPVYAKKEDYVLVNTKDSIEKDIKINPNLTAPIETGSSVGKVKYYAGGELIFESDLIVKDKVYQKGILQKFIRIYEEIFRNIELAK
ncbi:D-alanyl-D-alanine carboxypeptidase family protein [uncultured Peptoniphilus sp.]|uniref:D-alanyl-D-alanine carboxypeptidase family protein n=1 Tax=uncultured Peptoniphilus sp. TaxID=254354 RepID=UPI002803BE28|nr:D-alanyl-D-alanine carboxypeptidase family protein [uncultured Peptoniphilus sp.]